MESKQFRNDGSFMQQFLAMQSGATAAAAAPPATAPAAAPPAPAAADLLKNDGNFMEKFMAMQKAAAAPAGQTTSTAPAPAKDVDARSSRTAKPRQPKQTKPEVAAVFAAAEEDDTDPPAAVEDIPASSKKAIESCAGWVVQHGEAFEQTLKTKNVGNPAFQFLFDSSCKEAGYYREVLKEKRAGLAAAQAQSEARSTKRASRWGASATAAPVASSSSSGSSGPAPPFDPVAAAREAAKAVAARLAARAAVPGGGAGEIGGKRKFSEVAGPRTGNNEERSHTAPRLQHELDPSNAGRGIVPVPDLKYAPPDIIWTRVRILGGLAGSRRYVPLTMLCRRHFVL